MLPKSFVSDIESHTDQPSENLTQSIAFKVQYPDIGMIPHLSNESSFEVSTKLDQVVPQQKKDFLINFYNQLANRVLIIIIFQIFSCMKWFRLIVVYYKKSYLNHQFTFQEYANTYIKGYRSNRYSFNFEPHHYDEYRQFIESSLVFSGRFRWTFWLFIGILLISFIIIPLLRKNKLIKQHQRLIYYIQNILIAFIFAGITGVYSERRDYYTKIMQLAMLSFIGIWIFLKALYFSILYNLTNQRIQKVLLGCLIISCSVNLIGAIFKHDIPSSWIFIELIITYAIYYFCQLNQSIVEPIYLEDSQCSKLQKLITKLFKKNQVEEQAQEIFNQVMKKEYCIISRIYIQIGFTLIFLISLAVVGIFYIKFLILFAFIVLQFAGLMLQTQVVSNQIDFKTEVSDYNLSVCLMPFDFIFPVKNIMRSQIRYETTSNA